ncbi:hypothetical protein Afer_1406 [Acidimicrobium ferrooxidans DSM 10331]|uniref:Uncharacterized protein n=1 Tax=Acidimicrobium ferrooxidans (strain DSM 10331 / JCM 15462 / NBRC 103882 / ICP) TaxID=525909 RepID=C7M022_ACIFD|nr:hypothetical protein [Acidimicrobium ferrooxidans]ACU54330.1 hypothetical protein Afer_1406 [Acidimicrobium ferrooxidans DSM 10331]
MRHRPLARAATNPGPVACDDAWSWCCPLARRGDIDRTRSSVTAEALLVSMPRSCTIVVSNRSSTGVSQANARAGPVKGLDDETEE